MSKNEQSLILIYCVYNDGCLLVQEISEKATHKNPPQNTARNFWIFCHWQDEIMPMDQTPYVQATNSVRLKAPKKGLLRLASFKGAGPC